MECTSTVKHTLEESLVRFAAALLACSGRVMHIRQERGGGP